MYVVRAEAYSHITADVKIEGVWLPAADRGRGSVAVDGSEPTDRAAGGRAVTEVDLGSGGAGVEGPRPGRHVGHDAVAPVLGRVADVDGGGADDVRSGVLERTLVVEDAGAGEEALGGVHGRAGAAVVGAVVAGDIDHGHVIVAGPGVAGVIGRPAVVEP